MFSFDSEGKRLRIAGSLTFENALAAIALGIELEIPFATIAAGMATFSGVQRRMQVKGESGGVLVVDDYGHHPTEIRATLAAVRMAWPHRRMVVLFQPHRYTRTQGLFRDFCTAFHEADLLVMTEIYAAGEVPIKGISSSVLLDDIKAHGQRNVRLVPELASMVDAVLPTLEEGDLVLTLGAGDIYQVGEKLLAALNG